MNPRRMTRIEPRSGVALKLAKGETLIVSDPEGGQVSDLVCYGADDTGEVVSNGRTFDYEESIALTTGSRLWSNRSRVMLEIVEDTVGTHDFLLTPCSVDTFKHFYPDKPQHRGCFGNLEAALAPYGIGPDAIPTAFNLFMNVPVDGRSGVLEVKPPLSKAGDRIALRAKMDLIIGLTACSAYASNGGSFKPIDYAVLPA
ncbi:MAG: urea carboxylase-associated family protein [Alphaproteobacteria bacterium]|nr:urea carboxylase-associated family protein [Alphaproteobacteria bacterium]MBU1756391.1 urea carboxylase-associated family protein [Alphaproteobacteria bacterium]